MSRLLCKTCQTISLSMLTNSVTAVRQTFLMLAYAFDVLQRALIVSGLFPSLFKPLKNLSTR
jgi:hypothetical protein